LKKAKSRARSPWPRGNARSRPTKMINLHINERHDRLDRLQLAAVAGLMFWARRLFAAPRWPTNRRWRCRGMTRRGFTRSPGMCSAWARVRCCGIVDYHTLARWSFRGLYWAAIFFLVLCADPHIHVSCRCAVDGFCLNSSNFSRANSPNGVHSGGGTFPEPPGG